MGHNFVLNSTLSVISLLFIATLVAFLLRNSKVPFTVALVLVGLGVGFLGEHLEALKFLEDFRLSPELVFYVFLPTLIFESAFHMNIKHFTQNKYTILGLSTFGMLFSTALIGVGMYYFLDFPVAVALLFGAMISATDPISVLAMFKKIGAPKRLQTIVEGESLFNDGTALVLFGILLEFVNSNVVTIGRRELLGSFGDFGFVILGGLLTGVLMGLFFSKALDYVKDSKEIEISITLILAHSTFIIAEYFLGVSGILATVAAGIVIGNYGAYKISPGVKDIMTHFWDYSAFLANSLLFLLVGIIIYSSSDAIIPLFVPLILVILIVMLSRMIMIYSILPMINVLFPKERMPTAWIHVIQWSGLRGALAIALMLTLPENFIYYEEMLIFTVGVIFFTIIFNGFTINPLLTALGLKSFSTLERFEHEENKVLIDQKVKKKLNLMLKSRFISKSVHQQVTKEYNAHCKDCDDHIRDLFSKNKDELQHKQLAMTLRKHLLSIEKKVFTKLYYYGEITQDLLHVLLGNVHKQMDNLETNQKVPLGKLTWIQHDGRVVQFFEYLGFKGYRQKLRSREIMLRYEMFRARMIATSEVLDALKDIKKTNVFLDKSVIFNFEEKYKTWEAKAKKKIIALEKEDPYACRDIQLILAKQAAFHIEDKSIQEIVESGMTSAKVYEELRKDLLLRQEALNL